MQLHPMIRTTLLCFAILLTSCTYTTKLAEKLLPDSEYNSLVVKADAAMQDGRWAEASNLYEKASQIKPDEWALKLKAAKAYQYDGKLAKASNAYQIIVDAKLPSNEANNKIVKEAKENLTKFGFKTEPDVAKTGDVKESPHQETPQKNLAANNKVAEDVPSKADQVLTVEKKETEEITQSPQQAEALADDADKIILQAVNAWADAWETKNLKAYFAHYVHGFSGDMANAKAWQLSRKKKILLSKQMKIALEGVRIYHLKNSVKVVFKQSYQSGSYHDVGRKTLVMKRVKGRWLIKKESFS